MSFHICYLVFVSVDDHDGDNGWHIAIGDVDDDRITPIVITGQ